MIPAPTSKFKNIDTTSKFHFSVSAAMVPDSIVPTIIEPSSLAADFADMRDIMNWLESKVDNYITHLTILESKIVASPDLQQTSDPSLIFLPDKVQRLSSRLTHCELNHETVMQKFCNYKKDVHNFLEMGTPSYTNFSNLPSSSHSYDHDHDHDVPLSFRMVLEKICNPLDPLTNHHFQTS